MNRTTVAAVGATLAWAAACSGWAPDIHPAFEAAKAAAKRDPGVAPADFRPDAEAVFSADTTGAILRSGIGRSGVLSAAWEGKLAGQSVKVTPDLRLDAATLATSKACAGCLEVRAEISGPLQVNTAGHQQAVPVHGSLIVAAQTSAQGDAQGFDLSAVLKSVSHLSLDLPPAATLLRPTIEVALARGMTQALSHAAPISLGHVGGAGVLRVVRLEASGAGLSIAMSTRAATSSPLASPGGPPPRGVRLLVSPDAVVALAAAAAYDVPPDKANHEIVPVPTSLSVKEQRFVLGLRLWSLAGSGWWRDYAASGTLSASNRGIALTAGKVDEVAASPRAELADPAAALGRSVILAQIQQSLTRLLPVGSANGAVTLTSAHGERGAVELDADVTVPP